MEEVKSRKGNFKLVLWAPLIFASLFFVFVRSAHAATLYFSPSSGSYQVGKQFSVSIYVNSADQAMNAAEGTISFLKDNLSVVSISKSGSIMTLWAQEPSFSNSAGTIAFSGVDFNPGYTGAAGKIMTVTFKAKAEGTASLNFESASVLANDGAGTNIFTGDGSADFNIIAAGATPPAEGAPPAPPEGGAPSATAAQVPAAPKVSSSTHPDPDKWYANNTPSFEWTLPHGITGVNVLADHNPATNPGTRSDGLMNKWTYKNVDDGAWYFHIRLKNSAGWGAIAHFGFNIDTMSPEIISAAFSAANETDSRPVLQITATDQTSGLDHYEISIDGAAASIFPHNASGEYQLPALDPGDHKISIKAFDKAGNAGAPYELSQSVTALTTPVITDYSKKAALGGKIMVKGKTAYPGIAVFLWYQKDGGEPSHEVAKADDGGNFVYELKNIKETGSYKLWAEVMDEQGAKSNPTDKLEFIIYQSYAFRFLDWAKGNILWLMFALLILLLLFIIALYIRSFARALRMIITKEKIFEDEKLFYTSRRKIESLVKALEDHAAIIEKLKKKRRLSWKEKYLRHRYRKLAGWLQKYIK